MQKMRISRTILLLAVLGTSGFTRFEDGQLVLSALTAQAASIYTTVTDAQKVTYTIDTTNKTASVTAFSGAAGADIVIPNFVSSGGINYPVTAIGASAFLNAGLHSVVIGDNVIDINTSAFQTTTAFSDFYKKALVSVVLGKNVQNIKTDAFAGNALTSIAFPETLSKIGTRAFANNLLTSVSFGANVTEIMSKAFQSNLLTTVNFAPTSTATVGSMAFSGSPVSALILGAGVTWTDDALNKVSPIFGQLTDLPLTGVRTISVSADGSLYKSWLVKEPVQNVENKEVAQEQNQSPSDENVQSDVGKNSVDMGSSEIGQEQSAAEQTVSVIQENSLESGQVSDEVEMKQEPNQLPAEPESPTSEAVDSESENSTPIETQLES